MTSALEANTWTLFVISSTGIKKITEIWRNPPDLFIERKDNSATTYTCSELFSTNSCNCLNTSCPERDSFPGQEVGFKRIFGSPVSFTLFLTHSRLRKDYNLYAWEAFKRKVLEIARESLVPKAPGKSHILEYLESLKSDQLTEETSETASFPDSGKLIFKSKTTTEPTLSSIIGHLISPSPFLIRSLEALALCSLIYRQPQMPLFR